MVAIYVYMCIYVYVCVLFSSKYYSFADLLNNINNISKCQFCCVLFDFFCLSATLTTESEK